MAMLGDSSVGTKGILKMVFIPPREGVEHLCRELEAGTAQHGSADQRPVLRKDVLSVYRCGATGRGKRVVAGRPQIGRTNRLPLVEKSSPWNGAGSEAQIVFDPTADPFLLDHQFRGKPLLPAVIGLEAVAEAASLAGGKSVAAIRDVQLIEGLLFHTPRTLEARIRAVPQPDGSFACELVSDFRNRADKLIKKDRLHLRAVAELSEQVPSLDIAMPQPPTAMHAFEFQNTGPLYHGPTLHGVRGTTFDARGGWGQLAALSLARLGGTRPPDGWIVPATLLDAGFYVCGIHAWFNAGQSFSLPSSIERVEFGRMPLEDESCLLAFECREIDAKHAVYDFTVFGADRTAVLRVVGHRIVMVRP